MKKKYTKENGTLSIQSGLEFSSQIGTHKGGTVGCSYSMLPNESPIQCLRRMEKERCYL